MGRGRLARAVQRGTRLWDTRSVLPKVLLQPLGDGPVRCLLVLGQRARLQVDELIKTGEEPIDPVAKSGQVFGRDARHHLFNWVNLGDVNELTEQLDFTKVYNSVHT